MREAGNNEAPKKPKKPTNLWYTQFRERPLKGYQTLTSALRDCAGLRDDLLKHMRFVSPNGIRLDYHAACLIHDFRQQDRHWNGK